MEGKHEEAPEATTAAASAGAGTTLTLSTGAVAVLRRPKGRDLVRASVVAQAGGGGEIAVAIGLVAQVATIDGRGVTYEDLEEMDALDVGQLIAAVTSGNGRSPGLAT